MAESKMDCLSKFSEIKESIFASMTEKGAEEDWSKKWLEEAIGTIPQLYRFAEMIITKFPSGFPESLYETLTAFLNDTGFLKAALEEKHLDPETYFGVLESLSAGGFACLHDDAKKEIAGILFSSEEMQECCRYRINDGNKKFVSLILALDPESDKMAVVKRIAGMMLRSSDYDLHYDSDLFDSKYQCVQFIWDFAGGYKELFPEGFLDEEKINELLLFVIKTFLPGKVLESGCFKKLPRFFQEIALFKQLGYCKAGAALLPEFGIDTEELKKEIGQFLAELVKIAKNRGKPSDYYAGEPFVSNQISDTASYLTTQVFHEAVSFLKWHSGAWETLKPMLDIFRSLNTPSYYVGLKRNEEGLFSWAFLPIHITQLLGSLEEEKREKLCADWLDCLENTREENPAWKEAYAAAAEDLRSNSDDRKKALLNAWWNCRVAHLKSLGIDFDMAAAENLKKKEITFFYPKNFF